MSDNTTSLAPETVRRVDTAILVLSEVSALDLSRCEREGSQRTLKIRNEGWAQSIQVRPGIPGVRHFTIDAHSGLITAELSSRILGASFGEGISESTLGAVAAALSRLGYFAVTEEALSRAQVQRVDIFVDLALGKHELQQMLFALRALNGKHFRVAYDYASSIAFASRSQSTDVLLRAYDKGPELRRGNTQFRDLIGPDTVDRYDGVLRLERQARGRASIRAMLRLPGELTPVLGDVFESSARPVSQVLRRLIDATEVPAEYADLDEMAAGGYTLSRLEKEMGKWSIVRALGGDERRVERFARLVARRNAGLYLPDYRAKAAALRMGMEAPRVQATLAQLEGLYQRVRQEETIPCPPVAHGSTPQVL